METPEVCYRVNRGDIFEFMTLTEINATSHGLLAQLRNPAIADAKYVQVGNTVFQPYNQWLDERRSSRW